MSELVLNDAISSTFTRADGERSSFPSASARCVWVKTKRSEIVDRLNSGELTPEGFGLAELSATPSQRMAGTGSRRNYFGSVDNAFAHEPLIFCLFGAALVLRYNRKSRGFAIFSALSQSDRLYLSLSSVISLHGPDGNVPAARTFPVVSTPR